MVLSPPPTKMRPEEVDSNLIAAWKRALPHPYLKIYKDEYQGFPPYMAAGHAIWFYKGILTEKQRIFAGNMAILVYQPTLIYFYTYFMHIILRPNKDFFEQ